MAEDSRRRPSRRSPQDATPAPRVQDPADLGTCFGLEYSMDQDVIESAARRTPVRSSPLPAWLQKLTRRQGGR